MVKGLHLPPRHRKGIVALLHKHLPGVEVWAYGSRVNDQSHEGSDLDLVLRGPRLAEIDTSQLADFIEALQDSTIPFLVEARDWARLPKSFHSEIERAHVVLAAAAQDGRSEGGLRGFIRPAPPTLRDSDLDSEWSVDSVGDFFDLVTGYAFKSPDFCDDGIRVIKIKNVKAGHFSKHQFSYVSPDFLDTRSEKIALADDLLISMSGNRHDGSPETWVGKVAFFREEDTYLINQRVGALRLKRNAGFDPRFASFLLSSHPYQELFISIATSSGGQANLSPKQILGASVRYPEIGEQRALAHILGTLDDKIELNRRINETLEAMARALFKSWFVDFDPVRAKMAGRDTGLPKRLADLFPDRMVDSELGKIPEGWRQGTLADLARLNPESWSSRNAPDCILYVDLANTKWGYINDIQEYTWEGAPSRGRRVLRLGDTIVGTVRPRNGSFALIDRDGLTGSTAFAVLRPRNAAEREIVWCAATSGDAIERLAHLADGGAYPAVRPRGVLDTAVVLPDARVRLAFSSLAAPFLNRMGATQRESRTLATLRDTLLPKLISGQVRVGGVLAMMEGGDLGRAT